MNDYVLYEKVRSVLLYEWDPIGIKNFPEAEDEYDTYIQPICKMIHEGMTAEDIYNYLHYSVTENMLLDGDENLERIIANKLNGLSKNYRE